MTSYPLSKLLDGLTIQLEITNLYKSKKILLRMNVWLLLGDLAGSCIIGYWIWITFGMIWGILIAVLIFAVLAYVIEQTTPE
jgi:hypothetical protein